MADAIVRAKALRWISDDQPGVIEVSIVDSDGREHRIIEKVPVLTSREFTSASAFPADLWIRADTGTIEGERVQVFFAYSVETTEGLIGLAVATADVKWL
ncbi:hypothetical protein ABN034_33110 [Actinopolymorpha sp. B11F2]|uniref:hypothetical protein n=1 Tax=Actinopolymorpha sp. B11F2 TaxID=3160862 RepID=UPI0032E3ABEB